MKEHTILQKLMLSRQMTEGTKRAVRERLMLFLEAEEKAFARWNDVIRHKMNLTRQAAIERRFHKEIQALKIVIHKLTPFGDRVDDEPSIIVKKPKKNP
jgi:hypothetical protein